MNIWLDSWRQDAANATDISTKENICPCLQGQAFTSFWPQNYVCPFFIRHSLSGSMNVLLKKITQFCSIFLFREETVLHLTAPEGVNYVNSEGQMDNMCSGAKKCFYFLDLLKWRLTIWAEEEGSSLPARRHRRAGLANVVDPKVNQTQGDVNRGVLVLWRVQLEKEAGIMRGVQGWGVVQVQWGCQGVVHVWCACEGVIHIRHEGKGVGHLGGGGEGWLTMRRFTQEFGQPAWGILHKCELWMCFSFKSG